MDLFLEKTNILEIESSQIYRSVVCNINSSVMQDDDDWIFSDEEKIIKKSSFVDIINSPFLLDFNSRKMQKVVLDDLYNVAVNEENYEKTQKILSNLKEYAFDLEWQLPYDIEVENVDIRNLLKIMVLGVGVPEDFVEQFNNYIKVMARMLKYKIIIMVDAINCFNYDEWKLIEKTAIYEGIYILCIEHSSEYRDGNKIIIDCDGCRVV